MAESEPKPKLIELVGPGAGQGWKAVLKNGKPAVVHEIPVPPAEAAAAIPRIQRLAEHRHPALSPVLAWGSDPNGIWVAVEPNEGTPLSTLLSRGPLTPPAAASAGGTGISCTTAGLPFLSTAFHPWPAPGATSSISFGLGSLSAITGAW